VFRETERLKAAAREFTQMGVEFLGADGPDADAEVLLLLDEVLSAAGLKSYTVAVCTVSVLRELLTHCAERFDMDDAWQKAVLAACHASNLVELERLAADPRLDAAASQALRELPQLNGPGAVERCRELVAPLNCAGGLDALAHTLDVVAQAGTAGELRTDFSVMSAFDYYTGLVFAAYAPGLGVPLAGGGRYDKMLSAYGTDAPAAGFAASLEEVMQALVGQGQDIDQAVNHAGRTLAVNSGGTAASAAETFRQARELREAGERVFLTYEPAAYHDNGTKVNL